MPQSTCQRKKTSFCSKGHRQTISVSQQVEGASVPGPNPGLWM